MKGDQIYLVWRKVRKEGKPAINYVARIFADVKDAANEVRMQYASEVPTSKWHNLEEGFEENSVRYKLLTEDDREVSEWISDRIVK